VIQKATQLRGIKKQKADKFKDYQLFVSSIGTI